MRIGLDRKRLEAALINRSGPGGVMVGMPALRVRDGNPPQHLGEFPIMPRPEEEMPVIRHQAIGGDADAGLGVGLGENLLKRGIVSGLVKQREPSDTTVQDMIREVSSSEAWAIFYRNRCDAVKKRLPTTFLCSR